MRLFHAISIYQLMICIVLNLRRPTEEKTICILPDFIIRKFPEYKNLEKYHAFDQVVLYPYRKIPYPYTVRTLDEIGDRLYDETVPYPLEAFDEVYCAATQFAFAAYLALKNIPFAYIEEGAGTFEGMQRFKDNQKVINNNLFNVGEELGLIDASSPFIQHIYADFPKGAELSDPRVIRCNLVDELQHLTADDRNRLKAVFGAERVQVPKPENSLLFLTQHPANLQILTLEGQKDLVTLTVDYYHQQNHLVIKPHPDDFLYNQRIFPDATILPKLFPIELLLEFVDNEQSHVMTITSHSVNSMKAKDKIDFDDPYLYGEYQLLHVCYAAMRFVRALGGTALMLYTGNRRIFENWGLLVLDATEIQNNNKPTILYAESLDEEFKESIWGNAKKAGICILVHQMTPTLYDLALEGEYQLFAREIRIEYTDGDILKETDHQRLYFFIPGTQRAYVKKFSYERLLKYAKEVVTVKDLTDEGMKIAQLQGILEATERRLEAALKENDELKFELEQQQMQGR